MATTVTPNEVNTETTDRPTGRIVAGLGLLLPASLCCITELLGPTLRTFLLSLQTGGLIREAEFVGLENYNRLLADPILFEALGFTFSFVLVRLILVAVIPSLLAWAVGQSGRLVRLGARVLLTVPLVLFMPVAVASAWPMLLSPGTGGPFSPGSFPLAEPAAARRTLLLIDGLYTFGLACGLGLIFYLMVWHRPDESAPLTLAQVLKPLLATWGIGILATSALTLPSFTLSFIMTAGGPAHSTLTLGVWLYDIAFRFFRPGQAAALASLILMLALLLGLFAGLLVILARLRLVYVPAAQPERRSNGPTGSRQSKVIPLIVLAAALLLSLGACALSALPFGWAMQKSLADAAYAQLADQIPIFRVVINTIVPPLLAAIIQLLVAYPGALGIGAIRPLGKQSEWLLLPFSPWLFVTILPLSLVSFMSAREAGILDTFVSLIPPLLFSVPLLFILTLFFRGQAPRWRAALATDQSQTSGFFRHIILPSLPLVGMLLLFLLFIGLQELLWPLVVAHSAVNRTMPITLLALKNQFATSRGLLAAAVTLFALPIASLFPPALLALQLFYLDRLALRAGAEE